MNFKFKLGDTALDNSEAKALLSAAGKEAAIMIDIAEHVDPAMIDAKKLFSISVETKNPTLASLAARFAIEGVSAPGKRQYRRTTLNASLALNLALLSTSPLRLSTLFAGWGASKRSALR